MKSFHNVDNNAVYTLEMPPHNKSVLFYGDNKISIVERPTFKGYKSIYKTDLFHAFPKEMDASIVKYGKMIVTERGFGVIAPGYVNGTPGFYQINFGNDYLIYHRCFYSLDKAKEMYVDGIYFFK